MDAASFEQSIGALGPEGAVARLAACVWDTTGDAVNAVAAARALACPPREVRTVAAYHNVMSVGGAERVCAQLVQLWHDMGLRVVLLADVAQSECAYPLPEGTIWVQLPESFSAWHDSYAPRAAALAQALREHQVDALVYHQWWNPLLPWDMLLAKSLGVPFVCVVHNTFKVLFYEPHPNEFDVLRVLRHADGVVVLSQADKRFWDRMNPRVWQTCNPATLDVHAAEQSTLEGANVVWVGRLSLFDKQPQEAIEIMALVASQHPEARLILVGPSSAEDLRYLENLVHERGIENNVVFAGVANDASGYYRSAAVHLLTSKLDGWCLVLAESKAYGLPCVMYEMPYLATTQGNRGIAAVRQGDRAGAAAAICSLLEDTALRHSLGAQARAHALELAAFDQAALWRHVFDAVAQGSPVREGFDWEDQQWDMVVDGFKTALEKEREAAIASAMGAPDAVGGLRGLARRLARKIGR